MNSRQKYLVECRDENGILDFKREQIVRKEHPYLFSKETFTIDDLCYYMSFGQKRNNPSGPIELPRFMREIGLTYRPKTW